MNEVVRLTKERGVAVVALQEREHGNTFTQRFIRDLKAVFGAIDADAEVKVVVVHGYDNYFCCGGTKEELISLYESYRGREQGRPPTHHFTDLAFHDILLRCEVPVISAMQGHALGGGLAFGCFADIIVMGEQCVYSANFMKYGFSPGMGATYILPSKLGEVLGTEMLLTARSYYGHELRQRGAPVRVVSKSEVIEVAMGMARELAERPLLSLKTVKRHLTRKIRAELPEWLAQELEMHAVTFAQPEVRARIEHLFGN